MPRAKVHRNSYIMANEVSTIFRNRKLLFFCKNEKVQIKKTRGHSNSFQILLTLQSHNWTWHIYERPWRGAIKLLSINYYIRYVQHSSGSRLCKMLMIFIVIYWICSNSTKNILSWWFQKCLGIPLYIIKFKNMRRNFKFLRVFLKIISRLHH